MNYDHVELYGFAKFTHFMPMGFALLFPVMGISLPIISPGGKDLTLFWLIGIPAAGLVYWWLKRLLRYQAVHTLQGAESNYQAVLALAKELNWNIRIARPNEFIQASVKGFPKTLRSWGELVSIAFQGGDVYVNSICDPNKHSSLTAYGRNNENVEIVKRAVVRPNPSFNSDPTGTGKVHISRP